MMILCTIAIVLMHAVLAVQGRIPFQKSRAAYNIDALCADKPVALTEIPELVDLSYIVTGSSGSSCPDNVRTAIPDLLNLIRQTEDDLCAQESIDKLREFYHRYLDTSSEENKQGEQLPKSLRKFALAYGMQMSSFCKRQMVDVLANQDHDVLSTQAHEAIENLVGHKSPVADILKGLAGPDRILLPGDLTPHIIDKLRAKGASSEDDTIYVQSASAPYIREMQANCNQVFAPIYRPLIRPIVQFTNMGFKYKDEPLRLELSHSKTSKQLAKWARLVFLCESLKNIRMVDVPKQTDPSDIEDETVRILTKEEAAAIDDKSVSEPQPQVVENFYKPVIWYRHLILDRDDKKLKKAIKSFGKSKRENERVARRMMGKGVSIFKAQLKRHRIGLKASTGYKAMARRIRSGKDQKQNEELIKNLGGALGNESELHDSRMWKFPKSIAKKIGNALSSVVVRIVYIALLVLCAGIGTLDDMLFTTKR